MVAIDYSYRESDYYTKWYKQGIVPEDKLFAAYNGITNILGTVGSIFMSLKSNDSDDGDGKGGVGLNGTVKEDEGPSFKEQLQKTKTENFTHYYNHWASNKTAIPNSKLVEYAQTILGYENVDEDIKRKAKEVCDKNSELQKIIDEVSTSGQNSRLITGALGLLGNSRRDAC